MGGEKAGTPPAVMGIAPPAGAAFVGLGVMGHAMAANLVQAGYRVAVTSRTHKEVPGATWAATPALAAENAEIIGICVPDTPDVERVLFGPGGVAETVNEGAVVVDFSTISAEATRNFALRLKSETGAILLDSPVSGGPQGALDGNLTCMVGGDAAAFAAAGPFLAAVGGTVTHMGGSGAGQICKSANQMIISATMHAVFEALVLGRKAGLDPKVMRQALLGGSARSAVLENHALRWLEERFTAGFRAELMLKDMKLASAALAAHGVYAPMAAAATRTLGVVVETGRGAKDVVVLGQEIAERSGL
ncbi:NAD(P)-dependent oxidoreductase [Rhodovarius lipocyclicus]|uniref:NAD(P)-dependent oxidoreductase n=1 Tax=Rhodovarius lipocyclicus TaxID=268410 RepID=UPI00135793CF|nr:NAD(P)-dependent oxidoreductase [Rhodovarius lipocyclicus]